MPQICSSGFAVLRLDSFRSVIAICAIHSLATFAFSDNGELDKVRIRLVNGSSIRGTIESIDPAGKIIGSRILANVTLGQITSIETNRKVVDSVSGCRIMLSSGGFVVADQVRVASEKIFIEKLDGSAYELPIDAICGMVWMASDRVTSAIQNRSSEYDSIFVETKNGIREVKGILELIDQTHVHLNFKGKTRKISRDKVRAVVTALLGDSSPEGTRAQFIATDGSRFSGYIKQFSDNTFQLAITKDYFMSLSASKISRITIESDRVRFLSDMDPQSEAYQNQFTIARKWQRDKSLLGNSLQLKYNSNGRVLVFDKGIGTRSYSSIVFKNQGFDHLRAVVGIDMETGGQGDCEVVVEGDGIRLWSKRVTGNDDPEPIVVDIQGVTEVALVVLPGEKFDLADHLNWADARFTKSN